MAGEYANKLEEITGLLEKAVGGVDELRLEVRDLRSEVRELRTEVVNNGNRIGLVHEKLSAISAHFNDVGVVAIKDSSRIDQLEKRADALEANIH